MENKIKLENNDDNEYFRKRDLSIKNGKVYMGIKEIDIDITIHDFFETKKDYCYNNSCKYEFYNFYNKIYLDKYFREKLEEYTSKNMTRSCYDGPIIDNDEEDDLLLEQINIINLIPEKKKLSTETIELHKRYMTKMEKEMNITCDKYTDYDYVINAMTGQTNCTIKKSLCAIIRYLNENNDVFTEIQKKVIIKYRKVLFKLHKNYAELVVSGKLTPRQRKNYIEWDEILKKYEEIKNTVSVDDNIILALYINYPRRCDFRLLTLVKKTEEIKNNMLNYYITEEKVFVFLNFKNKNDVSDADKIIKVNDYTASVIDNYINIKKINYSDNFFGKEMTSNIFSKLISDTFKKYFGKSITTTLLRHSICNYDKDRPKEEQKNNARNMSHSMNMHEEYRRK